MGIICVLVVWRRFRVKEMTCHFFFSAPRRKKSAAYLTRWTTHEWMGRRMKLDFDVKFSHYPCAIPCQNSSCGPALIPKITCPAETHFCFGFLSSVRKLKAPTNSSKNLSFLEACNPDEPLPSNSTQTWYRQLSTYDHSLALAWFSF